MYLLVRELKNTTLDHHKTLTLFRFFGLTLIYINNLDMFLSGLLYNKAFNYDKTMNTTSQYPTKK